MQCLYLIFQFKMLLNILSILLNKTKYFLSKLRRIFPADNSPNEGVTALVTLFELTLESARELESEFPSVFKRLPQARQFSSNLSKAPVCDLLASFVEVHMNPLLSNISMHILHTYSIHFLRFWKGEFVQQSRASLVGDRFIYSHDLNVWIRDDIVRRN